MPARNTRLLALAALLSSGLALAQSTEPRSPDGKRYLAQPLVKDLYFADPSAHVFNGKLYAYPSHDVDAGIADDDLGNQYAMHDYRVLSMERIGGPVTVHPVALDVKQIPWASKQTWAPDAAYKNGTYYLYFPARDKAGVFRIGVATSKSPTGPFRADPQPIRGSFSIDPAVFTDSDGASYMYFGGIWGGQLQRWQGNRYDANAGDTDLHRDDQPAIAPRVARMRADMQQFAESPRPIVILDERGKPVLGGDHERRFFEAAWMFKRGGTYYFTYSTGDTHYLNYATGTSPYGPFRYAGHILKPVQGWTTHHSIVEFQGKWWLFYHDTQASGKNHLRSAKVTQLHFTPDGSIQTIDPFKD
ncbi:glycoside hydrolase family 43 protein [Sphingomonas sp. NIC1]|uniref:glycoside hydrolase family 43 protein n=1 Tax=Sphingomonas sp. NIC1 TaxID=1961362 RepID=UPI0007C0D682|nr:glycoside hydrolase family 43 protein [Sphingomonas sp. NIC1]ANC86126.1 alpha-N-arabinofuranosidase [Sphingomonas sp. NIC1]